MWAFAVLEVKKSVVFAAETVATVTVSVVSTGPNNLAESDERNVDPLSKMLIDAEEAAALPLSGVEGEGRDVLKVSEELVKVAANAAGVILKKTRKRIKNSKAFANVCIIPLYVQN